MKALITIFFLAFSIIAHSQSEKKTIYIGYSEYQIEQRKLLKKVQKEFKAGKKFCDLVEKYSERNKKNCGIVDFELMSDIDYTINKDYFEVFKKRILRQKGTLLYYGGIEFCLFYAEKVGNEIVLKVILRYDYELTEDSLIGEYDEEYEITNQ